MYIVKPREEHDVKDDDASYVYFCNTKVYSLIEYMENEANS